MQTSIASDRLSTHGDTWSASTRDQAGMVLGRTLHFRAGVGSRRGERLSLSPSLVGIHLQYRRKKHPASRVQRQQQHTPTDTSRPASKYCSKTPGSTRMVIQDSHADDMSFRWLSQNCSSRLRSAMRATSADTSSCVTWSGRFKIASTSTSTLVGKIAAPIVSQS